VKNNGHLPNSRFDLKNEEIKEGNKTSFHFCHGAPGAIPMLCLAAEVWPHLADRLLIAASEAGAATWA
jgi:hypothetical protein